jgi:hypothetical protein
MNNNSTEILKTNSDGAQYTGTVTIASYVGDRLIHKETHHNAGLASLFEFMSSCLQGRWSEARDKRPCKLVLLKQDVTECLTKAELSSAGDVAKGKGISVPNNVSAVDAAGNHYWGIKYAVCNPMMYDTAATTQTTDTSSAVTYHFRVPFLNLVGGSKVKKLMLLPPRASNYQTEACAYFVLKDSIEVPEQSGNFTIIIDWTLTFNNKTED